MIPPSTTLLNIPPPLLFPFPIIACHHHPAHAPPPPHTQVGFFHSFKDGVDYLFVDHSCYHNRGKDIYAGERQENMFRCALLCKAALEAVWHVPCGGIVYGDQNLCFIANDWHTALLPVYLQVGACQAQARCSWCVVLHMVRGWAQQAQVGLLALAQLHGSWSSAAALAAAASWDATARGPPSPSHHQSSL